MTTQDKRKQSLYFPEDMLAEMLAQAVRLDRSLSWVVQQAWKISRGTLKNFPSANDFTGHEALPDPLEVPDER